MGGAEPGEFVLLSDAPGAVSGLAVEGTASPHGYRVTGQPDPAATRQHAVHVSAGLSRCRPRTSGRRPPPCPRMSGRTPHSGLRDIPVFQLQKSRPEEAVGLNFFGSQHSCLEFVTSNQELIPGRRFSGIFL